MTEEPDSRREFDTIDRLWINLDAGAYEAEHGSLVFLKKCLSATNKVLVSKGLVTSDELLQALKEELTDT